MTRILGRKGWIVGAIVILYFLIGYSLVRHLCPAHSFEMSNQATFLSLLAASGAACGLGIAAAWDAALAAGPGYRYAAGHSVGATPSKSFVTLVVLAAAAVAVVAGANYFLQYACFAPERIVLHPDPFGAAHTAGWEQVTTVAARCWRTKGGRHVELTFWLDTGERPSMELTYGGTTFRGVGTALRSRPVRYAPDASVTADTCPADVYPLLQGWSQ